MKRAADQHRGKNEPGPMSQPTTTRTGNAAHGIFDNEQAAKSETEKAAERATGKRD